MNKNMINQCAFFIKSIQNRMMANIDFVIQLEMTFQSGAKEFRSTVTLQDGGLSFLYLGQRINCSVSELDRVVCECLEGYDGFLLKYVERGKTYLLEAKGKNVKMNTVDTVVSDSDTDTCHDFHSQDREYLIRPGQAKALLKAIGILSENNTIKNDMVRKYNQLDYFIEIIGNHVKGALSNKDIFHFIDCACGKSYLTFALNYYLTDVLNKRCYAVGIDYSGDVITASKKIAEKLQYRNMMFIQTDISVYDSPTPFDLLISLHACDVATDYALAYGINRNIPYLCVVPCCHRQMLGDLAFEPLEPVFKHGIFKTRINDILTDGARALLLEAVGYKVTAFEYISPLETPKNIMLLARKESMFNKKAYMDYLALTKTFSLAPALEKMIDIKTFF